MHTWREAGDGACEALQNHDAFQQEVMLVEARPIAHSQLVSLPLNAAGSARGRSGKSFVGRWGRLPGETATTGAEREGRLDLEGVGRSAIGSVVSAVLSELCRTVGMGNRLPRFDEVR